MFWIALSILIIAGWIIYAKRKRKGSITLSNEQAEQVLKLVRKEKEEIAQKMHDVVDKAALEGKTIPLDVLCKETADKSDVVKQEMLRIKQSLFEKYGPNIPVNTAHRISREWEYGEKAWSDNPGCFESHLQRRDGNPLFPTARRVVASKEIGEACERDRMDQDSFYKIINEFKDQLQEQKLGTIQEMVNLLQAIQSLIEEAVSIGGNVLDNISHLERIEDDLIQQFNSANPDGKELLEKSKSLSAIHRIPYFEQMRRKDKPILKEEEVPTLLSEDLRTISLAGYMSRAFAPDYRPNEADIKDHLDIAIGQGFSKDRAAQIIIAWNEKQQAI